MRYNREKKELTFDEAKDKALRLLEFRSHSERELSDKLKRAGAKEEDIDEILEFCRNYGFLDDRKYAIAKAKDLKNLKKYGKRRILMRTKKICFCLLLKKDLKVTLKRKTLINVYDILCTEVTAFLTLKIV